jgi:signal peptide peptidase SppA
MMLPHLAAHLVGVPLMIHRPKLEVILAVLGERIGLSRADAGPPLLPMPRAALLPIPGIAVIPVYGTLVKRSLGLEVASGLTSYQSIADQLDAALMDPAIAGILLDIDSAGGEASGAFDLADKIYAARQAKPICAIANDSAFSAAYALASAASKVVITRTGGIGSIGVIAMHIDQSAKDVKEGLTYTPVYSGEHKNDLSPHGPLTDAAKATLQTEVNRLYHLFVGTVARNRSLSADAITTTEAGLFFGQDAVGIGLADAVGNFDTAVTELFDLTQRPSLRGFFMKEPQMQTGAQTETPDHMAIVTTASDGVRNEGHSRPEASPLPTSLSVSDAMEIADLCTLAGCPEQISGYLSAQLPVVTVRQNLLKQRAQTPHVSSYLAPLPDGERESDDVMLKAVQKKLAAQPKQGATP